MHGSPDGPWFFLIAQSAPNGVGSEAYRLIGITDTSMLRPQVFALQQAGADGPTIGFAASEKQGIDAALSSLADEDSRFWPRADNYWNARGGSHTDGGAFLFTVTPNGDSATMACTDKFGRAVDVDTGKAPYHGEINFGEQQDHPELPEDVDLFDWFKERLPTWSYADLIDHLESLTQHQPGTAIETLTALIDRRYPTGSLRRSSLLSLYDQALDRVFASIAAAPKAGFRFMNASTPSPESARPDETVVIDARGFPQEGPQSLARRIVALHEQGFRKFIIAKARGHRFISNGFGPDSEDTRIDVYGSPGDYLASGIDGTQVYVHGNAQDQLAQIMKAGKLVVYGDVGQTFGYAAKGGQAYILGNAAGRPMINAVGKPKVVINGTCLDYLAESFMAGDPLDGGGFVILNGIKVTDDGKIVDLDSPYPGGNLFSLASGGAIYARDPEGKVGHDQLNGGDFFPLEGADWDLIKPYLEENERLFGIPLEALLSGMEPGDVYRKIRPKKVKALQAEEAWVREEH
jgi:glutamate synthase domain-containing protein 3